MANDFAIDIPWVMGLIGTRSFDQVMPGIKELVERNEERIIKGMDVYAVSYTHLTLPTILRSCRSRWSPYH